MMDGELQHTAVEAVPVATSPPDLVPALRLEPLELLHHLRRARLVLVLDHHKGHRGGYQGLNHVSRPLTYEV